MVQSDDDGKKVADEENRYICVNYYERSAIIPWERHLVCCKTVSNDFLSVRGFVTNEAHFMESKCWYSTEADKLFPLIDGGEEFAFDAAVVAMQKILLKAANNSWAMMDFLDNSEVHHVSRQHQGNGSCKRGNRIKDSMYASGSFNRFISHLQDRALYISCALSLVLKINGECEQLEWGKKCKHAIQLVNAAGKQLVSKDDARGGRTIQDWFFDFRSNRKFSNPFSNLSWSDGIQFFANNPGL